MISDARNLFCAVLIGSTMVLACSPSQPPEPSKDNYEKITFDMDQQKVLELLGKEDLKVASGGKITYYWNQKDGTRIEVEFVVNTFDGTKWHVLTKNKW